MQQGSRDIASGGVLLVLSVALYLAIPGQVETLTGDTLTPASLPFAITGIIGVLSAVLLFQGIRTRRASASSGIAVETGGLLYVGATIVVMIAYAALIPWIGYIAATAAVLLLLALLFNNRNWKQILVMMVIAPPAIMIFFRYTMLVLLPQGKLFG
jgi:hypothetical protein